MSDAAIATVAVAAHSVRKEFDVPGAAEPLVVLRDVDLTAHPGCIVLVGCAQGSGATTLIRCLSGTYRPTAGRVVVGGGELVDTSSAGSRLLAWVRSNRLAVLDGPLPAPPRATVSEAITRASGLGQDAARARLATGSLEALEVGQLLDIRLGSLRPDRARRVALAAALLAHRPVLLLDDPLHGLEPEAASAVVDALVGRRHEGVAVVVTSPSSAHRSLDAIADRAYTLDEGVIRCS